MGWSGQTLDQQKRARHPAESERLIPGAAYRVAWAREQGVAAAEVVNCLLRTQAAVSVAVELCILYSQTFLAC